MTGSAGTAARAYRQDGSQRTRPGATTKQDELNYFSSEPVVRPVRFLVLEALSPQPLGVGRARLERVSDSFGVLGGVMSSRRDSEPCPCRSGRLSRGATRSVGEMGEHWRSCWQILTHFFGGSRVSLGEALAYFVSGP